MEDQNFFLEAQQVFEFNFKHFFDEQKELSRDQWK
jgi:hypothetical protein